MREQLMKVTERILISMENGDLSWKNLKTNRKYTGRPNEWDINCGWCEEWANSASKEIGGEAFWLDELNSNFGEDGLDISHCILAKDNRYYDSQHIDGVDSLWDMDIVNGVTREQFLKNKAENF